MPMPFESRIFRLAKDPEQPDENQDAFGIADPKQRARFRSHLRALTTEALKVEQAALGEKPERVIEGMGRMWTQGCLACHEAFRSGG